MQIWTDASVVLYLINRDSATQPLLNVFVPFQSEALVLSLKMITLGEPVFPHAHSKTQQKLHFQRHLKQHLIYLLLQSDSHNPEPLIFHVLYKSENRRQWDLQLAECLQSWEEFFYRILHKSRNGALGPESHMIQQMLFPASASFHSEATASMSNSAPWITYKILLACINERPDSELQQKYNTQLLFERTKERQLSPFPTVTSKGCRHTVHDGPTWEASSNNHISQLPKMSVSFIITLML